MLHGKERDKMLTMVEAGNAVEAQQPAEGYEGVLANDSPVIRRALFRVFLHSQLRQLPEAQRKAVQTILGNDPQSRDAFNAVVEAYADTNNDVFSAGGTLSDFLQWLLDHAPQIIAFIQMIIALFVKPVPPPPPARDIMSTPEASEGQPQPTPLVH